MKFKLMSFVIGAFCVNFLSCKNDDSPITEQGNEQELKGELTADRTLKSGNTYSLTGGYHVKSGAKLTIEKGVTI
ncbi:MAG: hypothetical protein RSA92_00620, partial [Bacteroidaceae bacterium]